MLVTLYRKVITVLILVLMEDTLRVKLKLVELNLVSLNPCCNGRYYQRVQKKQVSIKLKFVLILVVMEDTLRESETYESFV